MELSKVEYNGFVGNEGEMRAREQYSIDSLKVNIVVIDGCLL